MADEISDNRFKSEMMRMMQTVISKLDEHDQRFESIDQRFESIDQRFESIDQRFDRLEKKVDRTYDELKVLQGQFTDVVQVVLKDNQRVTKLEKDVEDLKSTIH